MKPMKCCLISNVENSMTLHAHSDHLRKILEKRLSKEHISINNIAPFMTEWVLNSNNKLDKNCKYLLGTSPYFLYPLSFCGCWSVVDLAKCTLNIMANSSQLLILINLCTICKVCNLKCIKANQVWEQLTDHRIITIQHQIQI